MSGSPITIRFACDMGGRRECGFVGEVVATKHANGVISTKCPRCGLDRARFPEPKSGDVECEIGDDDDTV